MGMPRHAQFIARTVMVQGNVDKTLRVLNHILTQEGFLKQFRHSMYFEKPCQTRRRVNYEKCKAIYEEDMQRKIKFILRQNREDPYPGCS